MKQTVLAALMLFPLVVAAEPPAPAAALPASQPPSPALADRPAAEVAVKPRRSAGLVVAHGINVALSASLTGAWAGTWVDHYEKRNISAASYIEAQTQPSVFGTLMPALMVGTALSHVGVMVMTAIERGVKDPRFILAGVNLLISIATFVSSLVINVPINDATAGWRPDSYPADWEQVRGRWMDGHTFRTAISLPMLASAIAASLID